MFSPQEKESCDKKMIAMLHEFRISHHALQKEFGQLLNHHLRQWDCGKAKKTRVLFVKKTARSRYALLR